MCDDPDAFVPLLRIWSFFDTASRNEDSELGWNVGAHVPETSRAQLWSLEETRDCSDAFSGPAQISANEPSAEATDLEIGIKERPGQHFDSTALYASYAGRARP